MHTRTYFLEFFSFVQIKHKVKIIVEIKDKRKIKSKTDFCDMSNLTLLRREEDKSNLGKSLNITVEKNPYVSNPVNNAHYRLFTVDSRNEEKL